MASPPSSLRWWSHSWPLSWAPPQYGKRRRVLPPTVLNFMMLAVGRLSTTADTTPPASDTTSSNALCRYCSRSRKRSAIRPVAAETSVSRTVPGATAGGAAVGVGRGGLGSRLARHHSPNILSARASVCSISSSLPMPRISVFHVSIPLSSVVVPADGGGSSRAWRRSSLSSVPLSALAIHQDPRFSTSICSCPGAQPLYPTHSQKSLFSATPAATSALAPSSDVYDTPGRTVVDSSSASAPESAWSALISSSPIAFSGPTK